MLSSPSSRLDALDPNAYAAFQASNDLRDVVERVQGGGDTDGGGAKPGMKKNLSVRANIMTPVKPMLVRIGGPNIMTLIKPMLKDWGGPNIQTPVKPMLVRIGGPIMTVKPMLGT